MYGPSFRMLEDRGGLGVLPSGVGLLVSKGCSSGRGGAEIGYLHCRGRGGCSWEEETTELEEHLHATGMDKWKRGTPARLGRGRVEK